MALVVNHLFVIPKAICDLPLYSDSARHLIVEYVTLRATSDEWEDNVTVWFSVSKTNTDRERIKEILHLLAKAFGFQDEVNVIGICMCIDSAFAEVLVSFMEEWLLFTDSYYVDFVKKSSINVKNSLLPSYILDELEFDKIIR